jgi:stress response protein YsnF
LNALQLGRAADRTVNRPVTAADEALFQERTIEASETSEEAVVAKEARVKEELVVRKDAEERVQTVSDTVRRTEVEIEDDRTTGAKTTGPAARTTRTPGPDRG